MTSIFRQPRQEEAECLDNINNTPQPVSKPERKEKEYLTATTVAGRQYYDADDAWCRLHVGQKLRMEYEPENTHDENAISLWADIDECSYKLGYLPRQDNEFLASMIRMGWGEAFECVISRLDPSESYQKQIGITLKVVSK